MLFRVFLGISLVVLLSCNTGRPAFFGKRSPHELYAQKLADAGLQSTALGSAWLSAAERALSQPVTVSLPYRITGYFAAENPRAVGLRFPVKRGEKLTFRLEKRPVAGFGLYMDLWNPGTTGGKPQRLLFADTSKADLEYEVIETGSLVLRLQPELLRSGNYTLSISVSGSLAFPVSGKAGKVGSFWGADRDAGARSHEGIDIFAPKRTPVVAAAPGRIGRVQETAIGGKVVWLNPTGKSLSLYYAHLDEQLVRPGQAVEAGDTLGLVGNTGNAKTTPPHLHFGIYGAGGAVDPFPFVDPAPKLAPAVTFSGNFNEFYRLTAPIEQPGRTFGKNTVGRVLDAGNGQVFWELPDGTTILVTNKQLQRADNQLFRRITSAEAALLDAPAVEAPVKKSLAQNETLIVRGIFGTFSFVEAGAETGWIPTAQLR
jgi:murein DD-endopeptidase MepM/ murein hydrolase activator NlpD